ncbi:MAG: DUF368 domain-containing protein [Bacilli bacterium]|nr:DUF368 domain-containing protein [Bacilli bacterium]
MKSLILVLKGFFMGIANIIPGVSGGTIAIILGIYEQFISSISHLLSDLKKNLKFLIPIVIGMGLSILLLSGVIEYSYDNFPLPTMMFFVGLVIGGIPMLFKNILHKKENKEVSSYLIMFLTFSLVIFMACADLIFGTTTEVNLSSLNVGGYIILFGVGVIAAATMVIPGISGSLMLMLLGYYYPIVRTISDLVKFNNIFSNIMVLGVFGIGVLVGMVLISKLLEMLFKKFKTKTYFGVLGFIFASIIAIPISTCLERGDLNTTIPNVIISIIFLIAGSIVSYKLGEK